MPTRIPTAQLSQLSELVARTIGWDFPPSRWKEFEQSIIAATRELGFADPAEGAASLLSGPLGKMQVDALANSLTVGETYFFRDGRIFDLLAHRIIPDLVSARRDQRCLRIWSTACCTGEEPFSIAMLLQQAIPDWRDWDITLLATDINPHFLHKAEKGVFGEWSFRSVPADIRPKFFRRTTEGKWELLASIRQMVRFLQLNLVDDVYPSLLNDTTAMDLIICRNVLMYFTQPQSQKVIEKLYRAQVDGGCLIASPSESPHVLFPPYQTISTDGTILYRKNSHAVPSVPSSVSCFRDSEPIQATVYKSIMPPGAKTRDAQAIVEETPAPSAEALSMYATGQYAEAIDLLDKSLVLKPHDSASLSLRIRSLANQGKLGDALFRCDQWISADKLNPSSHYLRSIVLQEQNEIDAAIESLGRALYLDPSFVLAHFTLANIARSRGRLNDANRHMDNALRSLRRLASASILPESDGITAGRMAEIIGSFKTRKAAA